MHGKPMVVALSTLLCVSLAPPAAGTTETVPVVKPSEPDVVRSVNGTNAPSLPPASVAKAPAAGPAAVTWPKTDARVVTTSKPSEVAVRRVDRGLSISVRRTDGAVARGPVRLTVDYSGFRDAFGGDWASRLRLLKRDGSWASGVRNDLKSGRLSADVMVGSGEEQFALAAAPEGPTGDYKATSLSPSGKWQVSTQSGAFSWGYEMRTPPVPGGLQPELSAGYNSNAVDGRTVSSNSQPSWLGEGWSLWPGFIERSYKGCADDLGGNNGQTKTGDLCWETENATMSFGDHSGQLVLQGGVWRPKDDDGTKVERLLNAANGDQGDGVAGPGEYWKVTTTDGTQYFFGRRTDSAWTVPVFGNDNGPAGREPCNQSTFDTSECEQAYRWNLDYVVDRHGNSMNFFYREEGNLYGANMGRRGVSYTRGGTLERIEYGTRDGQSGQAPARVWFDIADRCTADCTVRDAGHWPDVPWDQECTSGTCATKVSPSFWSTKRLGRITTQISTGGGNYRNVDQWVFSHGFPSPGDGTTAALWLTGITRTGLPTVVFEGTMYQNRVNSAADGMPKLNKNRITTINTESGGAINVAYATQDCVDGAAPPPVDTNPKRCFPVRWAMPPSPTPRDDWFHKYVVKQIVEDDRVGSGPEVGSKPQVTNYDYLAGGAWASDDNPLIDTTKRTWSEWRGYEKVVVRKGNEQNKPESWTQHHFFRGMHGDKLKAGGTKTVDIVDSTGTRIADAEPLAGFEREAIVKDGADKVTGEIHTPWTRLTATQDTLKAYQVENARTVARTKRKYGADRVTRVDTTYDEHGNPETVNDAGDLASTTDDRCTTTSYAKNVTAMLVDLPSTVTTIGVACGSTPSFPSDAIADSRTYYDNGSLGAPPGKGDVTKTEVAKDYAGSVAVYLKDKRATYDGYGRALESFDALGRKTTTSYVETNGLTTSSTVTNALGHVTTTTLDPVWGQPVRAVDPNNRTTSLTYDALGRLSKVWKPGRTEAAGDSPHVRYGYEVRNDGPSWVKTETLKANGNHVVSYALMDGFLRERQTQAPSPEGGRILTDTLYDSRGLVNVKRAPYYHKDAPPGTTLFIPSAGEVPNATVKVYDGAERETQAMYVKFNQVQEGWTTTTGYGGDHATVVPPVGGTTTLTIKDAQDRTTHLRQIKSGSEYNETAYSYTKRGELASVTDPAGNVWRYSYDVLGRRVRADDPDHGVSTMTYDDAGQLLTTTDARNKTITTAYDDLGRKTETRLGSAVLTRSVYDILSKGALTSTARYVGASAYSKTVAGYDVAGRPTGESITVPAIEAGLAGTYTTTLTYAADGSPASTSLPALSTDLPSETLVHGYDNFGQPDTVKGATEYLTDTKYTALGEPTQMEMGAEGKRLWRTTYREDGTRRVGHMLTEREQPNGVMVNDLAYAYDPVGNVTKIADRTAGFAVDTQCFGYDYLRRVTSAWTSTDNCTGTAVGGPAPYWHQYTYDPIGNRTSQTRKGLGAADTLSTYTYPTGGDGVDRPHAVNTIRTGTRTDTYGYDAAGNTTSRPGQTLNWNDEGLLESVNTTRYLYDADGKQLIRRDSGSVTLFVGGGEVRLDTATGTEAGTRYYEHLGTRSGAGLTWTVADHHGTSQVAIDSNSLAATPRRLDLFGNPRTTGPTPMSGWPAGSRGFVGGITNDASGLTRLGAREYDPALGKFISADPIVNPNNPQQMNAYAYSNNNPTTFSDPSGLYCDSCDFYAHRDGTNSVWKQPRRGWWSSCMWTPKSCYPRSFIGPIDQRYAPPRIPRPKPVPVAPRTNCPGSLNLLPCVSDPRGTPMTDAGIPGTLPREHNKPQGRRPILVPISQTPGGGTHGSGSVCVSGAAALIYGGGLEGCASFDNYGLTLNGAIKQFGTGGAHLALGLSGQASTDSASQVNSGTSLYGQASLKAALGVGAEGAVGGEYSLDDGHVSGYGQGGGLLGVAGSVGEVGMEHGGNTGYLVRWPFVSGPSYVLVNDAILCQPWCARPPDPVY